MPTVKLCSYNGISLTPQLLVLNNKLRFKSEEKGGRAGKEPNTRETDNRTPRKTKSAKSSGTFGALKLAHIYQTAYKNKYVEKKVPALREGGVVGQNIGHW